MAYKIYMIDPVAHEQVELDTEDLDLSTVFSIADIQDIAKKKDTITKTVQLKATKVNCHAFGFAYHLNSVTDTSLGNKLFFNYNPLRLVDCVVMEDSQVLFRGTIRLVKSVLGKNRREIAGFVVFITGKPTDFRTSIDNKLLTDLSFTDLQHKYTPEVIFDSQATRTQRYDSASGQFIYAPFKAGSGYCYPFIDYGITFRTDAENAASYNGFTNKVNVSNFKAAVFVREYFNRIIKEAGFTYEVKGSPHFINTFDSLAIPNSDEKLIYRLTGAKSTFRTALVQIIDETQNQDASNHWSRAHLMPVAIFTPPSANTIAPYIKHYQTYNQIMSVDRTVTTDARASLHFQYLNTGIARSRFAVFVQLVERNAVNNADAYQGWEVIQEQQFILEPDKPITDKTITLTIGERKWEQGKQVAFRVFFQQTVWNAGQHLRYRISSAEVSYPKDEMTPIIAEVKTSDGSSSDTIAPKPPENIKQSDFIKSIMDLLNMYVYTEVTNPKHLIFERYNDYYWMAAPQYVVEEAIDWTKKIDKNTPVEINSNLTLPKSYLFTYKDDNDRLNDYYKKRHGETYGTFKFTDAFGVTDTKKVELIFSPTPIEEYPGTKRLHPTMYQLDGANKKPAKTNIRILFYNGLMDCADYTIAKEKYINNKWVIEDVKVTNKYANISTFYYKDGLPVEDLNFGRPNEFFITVNNDYMNAPRAFTNYYVDQITEMTNPNLWIVDCEAMLNEFDIANLDLKRPVFIDLGEAGHAYFKVLSVTYENNNTPSKVKLQKIFIGTER